MALVAIALPRLATGQEAKGPPSRPGPDLKAFFDRLDKNHDGKLTADEFAEGMKQIRQQRMAPQGPMQGRIQPPARPRAAAKAPMPPFRGPRPPIVAKPLMPRKPPIGALAQRGPVKEKKAVAHDGKSGKQKQARAAKADGGKKHKHPGAWKGKGKGCKHHGAVHGKGKGHKQAGAWKGMGKGHKHPGMWGKGKGKGHKHPGAWKGMGKGHGRPGPGMWGRGPQRPGAWPGMGGVHRPGPWQGMGQWQRSGPGPGMARPHGQPGPWGGRPSMMGPRKPGGPGKAVEAKKAEVKKGEGKKKEGKRPKKTDD
jgi:hypothetical protein